MKWRAAAVALTVFYTFTPESTVAADPQPGRLEQSVKAAFVCKFLSYVEWPPDKVNGPQAAIVIGVVDAPYVLAQLNALVQEGAVTDRPVEVRAIEPGTSLGDTHVLYVAHEALDDFADLAGAADEHSILVITESPQGLLQGGVINFVLANQRVRFEISLAAAQRRGLKLRSHLLALAQRVVGEPDR